MSQPKDVYLVIGGSGFVGRHIVQLLLDRGDDVSVFDIVQRYHDTPFYSGDISDEEVVLSALRKSGTTCIIHTASPPATLNNPALFWKVNVDGTKAVIAAAVKAGVRKLVYTSSAGVVFDGADIIDGDERLPLPETPLDAYNESKAKGEEAILEANGKGGLLTVALRPAGIFGPGDRHFMSGLYKVYENGQTHFQIGDNTNLFDFTYVTNVARAHLLAADKLVPLPPQPSPGTFVGKETRPHLEAYPLTKAEADILHYPLGTISNTTGHQRIPTSEARPLGPYVTPPPNAEAIQAAFENPSSSNRLVLRSRFDALTEDAIAHTKATNDGLSPLQVSGQAFFITNGEPCYFWDFARTVWRELDAQFPEARKNKRKPFVLPRTVGLAAATGAEWFSWLMGTEPTFTRFKVSFSCATRWHNIEKARRVLGYEPEVGLDEGIKRMVDWWASDR